MTPDPTALAAVFAAMGDVPARLIALERQVAEAAACIETVVAALPPVLLSVPQAARAWQVSIPTMRRWVKAGRVPVVKVGATVRVDMSRLHGLDDLAVARRARQEARAIPSRTALSNSIDR